MAIPINIHKLKKNTQYEKQVIHFRKERRFRNQI